MTVRTLDKDGLVFEILTAKRPHPPTAIVQAALQRAIKAHPRSEEKCHAHLNAWWREQLYPDLDEIAEIAWIQANAPETTVEFVEGDDLLTGPVMLKVEFTDKARALQFKLTF